MSGARIPCGVRSSPEPYVTPKREWRGKGVTNDIYLHMLEQKKTTFISFARTPLTWPQVNVDLQRYLTRKEFLGSSTPKALWKHSRSTLYALPTHSQCTPNALSNHSQSTPKALPKHSQSAQSRFWLAKLKLCISCSVSLILCYRMRSEPIVKTSFQ